MTERYCILCPSIKTTPTLLSEKTKPEHPIHNALGGRLESRELLCDTCNGELGSTIDKQLVNDFLWIRNGLEIRSGRRQAPPPIRGVDSPIGKILLNPGWKPQRARTERIQQTDKNFRIIAHDSEQGVDAIVNYLRSKGISTVEEFRAKFQLAAKDVHGRLPTAHIDVAIGGPGPSRAIAKIAFEYLAYVNPEIAHDSAFDTVRTYIRVPFDKPTHTNDEPAFIDFSTPLPLSKRNFPNAKVLPCHSVSIWTAQVGGEVSLIAAVILFGLFRWTVELASKWSGAPIAHAYALNPMTGEAVTCQLPRSIALPLSWKSSRKLDQETIGGQIWKAKLMCEHYQEQKAHYELLMQCSREVLGIEEIPGDRLLTVAEQESINALYNQRQERFKEDYRREEPRDMQELIAEIERQLRESKVTSKT